MTSDGLLLVFSRSGDRPSKIQNTHRLPSVCVSLALRPNLKRLLVFGTLATADCLTVWAFGVNIRSFAGVRTLSLCNDPLSLTLSAWDIYAQLRRKAARPGWHGQSPRPSLAVGGTPRQ